MDCDRHYCSTHTLNKKVASASGNTLKVTLLLIHDKRETESKKEKLITVKYYYEINAVLSYKVIHLLSYINTNYILFLAELL